MIKNTVIKALRLSTRAAELLDSEIERNIKTARLDLVRVGVSEVRANDSTDDLINDAIVVYCMGKLGPEDRRSEYMETYRYQADCLRKQHVD